MTFKPICGGGISTCNRGDVKIFVHKLHETYTSFQYRTRQFYERKKKKKTDCLPRRYVHVGKRDKWKHGKDRKGKKEIQVGTEVKRWPCILEMFFFESLSGHWQFLLDFVVDFFNISL
jgi:hypothetical protein